MLKDIAIPFHLLRKLLRSHAEHSNVHVESGDLYAEPPGATFSETYIIDMSPWFAYAWHFLSVRLL